jgi:hypothetical protein
LDRTGQQDRLISINLHARSLTVTSRWPGRLRGEHLPNLGAADG